MLSDAPDCPVLEPLYLMCLLLQEAGCLTLGGTLLALV
jgi:hypothetical protein